MKFTYRKLNDHLSGKELFIQFTTHAFRKLLSIYVFSSFPFVLRERFGIWLYQFLIIAYLFTFYILDESPHDKTNKMTVRPVKTQISLGICPVWSESSLSTWRKLGSLANHWVHSEGSDQTEQMPRLIWVFAGRTVTLLVLSWGGTDQSKTPSLSLKMLESFFRLTNHLPVIYNPVRIWITWQWRHNLVESNKSFTKGWPLSLSQLVRVIRKFLKAWRF